MSFARCRIARRIFSLVRSIVFADASSAACSRTRAPRRASSAASFSSRGAVAPVPAATASVNRPTRPASVRSSRSIAARRAELPARVFRAASMATCTACSVACSTWRVTDFSASGRLWSVDFRA